MPQKRLGLPSKQTSSAAAVWPGMPTSVSDPGSHGGGGASGGAGGGSPGAGTTRCLPMAIWMLPLVLVAAWGREQEG